MALCVNVIVMSDIMLSVIVMMALWWVSLCIYHRHQPVSYLDFSPLSLDKLNFGLDKLRSDVIRLVQISNDDLRWVNISSVKFRQVQNSKDN